MGNALEGKVALITGASRGLGREVSRALWREGASTILIARSSDLLRVLADELRVSGTPSQHVLVVTADLAEDEAVAYIARAVDEAWDRVDILVNNAAIPGPIGDTWSNNWEDWRATIRVNLLAAVELCRAFAPGMIRQRRGKIVNVSGGGATGPRPNFSAYATAKAGLVRFSEILAHELRPFNVQVNCIAPGVMNTEMLASIVRAGAEKAGGDEHDRASRQMSAERSGSGLRRAAELCLYLATPASDSITAKLISAVWDPWESLVEHAEELTSTDIYTLRRIVPGDRGADWG